MFEPARYAKGIGIDNDEKGLYLYLGFNLLTVVVLISFFLFIGNGILFILNILSWFFYSIKNAYVWAFYLVAGMFLQLAISLILILIINFILSAKLKLLHSIITKIFHFVLKYIEFTLGGKK